MTNCDLILPPRGRRALRRLPALAAACLALAAGCDGPRSSVEGLVTLDGRPLPGARISFHPDSPGPVAYGLSLDDGSYWLKTGARQSGLAPGSYRVTVFAMKVTEGDEQAAGPLLTPALYADPRKTPLRCRVEAGRNEIPLNLETTDTPARP